MDLMSAMALLGDLLPEDKQMKNLFDEPVAPKRKLPPAAWRVTGLVRVHTEQECKCCGNTQVLLSARVLVRESYFSGDLSLADHEADDVMSLKTENPKLDADLPVLIRTMKLPDVPFCQDCIEEQASKDLLAVLLAQTAKAQQFRALPKAETEEAAPAISLDDLL